MVKHGVDPPNKSGESRRARHIPGKITGECSRMPMIEYQ
jgi:hypothetical protein